MSSEIHIHEDKSKKKKVTLLIKNMVSPCFGDII